MIAMRNMECLLTGMKDAQNNHILFCALDDNTIRLFDLPSFKERGRIFAKGKVRSIHIDVAASDLFSLKTSLMSLKMEAAYG